MYISLSDLVESFHAILVESMMKKPHIRVLVYVGALLLVNIFSLQYAVDYVIDHQSTNSALSSHPLTNYTISVKLNTTEHTVSGETRAEYVNYANVSLSEVVFRLYPNAFKPDGNITIFSIRHAGFNLSYTVHGVDMTILTVDLVTAPGPGAIAPGANITLDLEYVVYVPRKPDRFGWYSTSFPEEFLVYNLGNWHPIAAVHDERGWNTPPYVFNFESFYSEVASYEVYVEVPEEFTVAATGELQTVTSNSGRQMWHWKTGPVRDFTWCTSPNYHTSNIHVNGVNVTSYYTTSHQAGGQRVLQTANKCLSIFSDLFGPYAWSTLSIVETSLASAGMEYPQLVMINHHLYDDPSTLSPLESVTAHEIGHEWVPFTVGTDSYAEPWIDEGFASYTEFAFLEYSYGSEERQSHRRNELESYRFFVYEWGDDTINQSMDYWVQSPGYLDTVYNKASLVIDMLRHQMGNNAFYEAWKYVYQTALHKNIRASDLQRFFEESVGEPLGWFFNQWIFGKGVITVSLDEASTYDTGVGWTVNFTLNQAQDDKIRLRVPIQILTTNSSELFWVWMDTAPETGVSLSVSSQPLRLILDPEELLLCWYSNRSIDLTGRWIESCNQNGERRDSFTRTEDVYLCGIGFLPSTTYDVYIVRDVVSWTDNMTIPSRVLNTTSEISSNSTGGIPPVNLWRGPLNLGKFDVVIDVDGDGKYDERVDVLDDNDLEITAGLFIPEFTMLITLLFVMVATLSMFYLAHARERT